MKPKIRNLLSALLVVSAALVPATAISQPEYLDRYCKNKRVSPDGNCKCSAASPGNCLTPDSCQGTAANETIECVSSTGCVINSGAGNDTVKGSDKRDFICTGSGNDTIESGTSTTGDKDYVDAGSGNDTAKQ
jgi:hypothetical protein